MERILNFLKTIVPKQRKIVFYLVLDFAFALVSLASPEVLRIGTNAIENKDMESFKSAAVLAIVSTIIFLILDAFLKIYNRYLKNIYEEEIQLQLMDKIISMKKIKAQDFKTGDIVTNVINNAMNCIDSSFYAIFSIFNGTIIIIFSIVYMGSIQWKITLIFVIYTLLLRFILAKLEKKLKTNSKKSIEIIKSNNNFMFDILSNMTVVKVFDKINYFSNKMFERETETLKINTKMTAWRNGLQDGMWAAVKFSEYFILYGFGGYMVYKGEATLGVLMSFTVAIDLFSKGFNELTYGLAAKNAAIANIENLEKILDIEDIENKNSEAKDLNDFVIKFEDVCFSHGETNIFNNLSFTIKQNEKIMITGANGSGKSTLLNLIAKLYDPESGKISFGKSDISVINLDDLTKKYAYITQKSNILQGDVYQNLALTLDYDVEKCKDILKKLNIKKNVNTSPKALSQGEKQRLNLGRALYKLENIFIVLGDEIFANIDKKNADNILLFIHEMLKDKTVIMICHEDINYEFNRIFEVKNKNVEITMAGGGGL